MNVIKLKKKLSVAILGTETFDALQVNPITVRFGRNGAVPIRDKTKDFNRDGFLDLILTFKTNDTGIRCVDTNATLTGETFVGEQIEGSDSFTVKKCKR